LGFKTLYLTSLERNNHSSDRLCTIQGQSGTITEFTQVLICAFESSCADYSNASQPLDKAPSEDINGYKGENFAYMISGLLTNSQLDGFVDQVKPGAQYLFMTFKSRISTPLWKHWEEFVGEIPLSPATSLNTAMHK